MAKKKHKSRKDKKAAEGSIKKKAKKGSKNKNKKNPAKKPKKDKTGKTKSTASSNQTVKISREQRLEMIRIAAYYLAQKRGFPSGSALDDWLMAEQEIDSGNKRTEN